MKKLLFLFISTLFFSTTDACHIEPLGQCGDKQFFTTKDFEPYGTYLIRYKSDTLLSFTTGATAKDSVFSIPLLPNQQVYLKYTHSRIAPDSVGWNSQPVSLETQYELCNVLPITINNISALKSQNSISVSFNAENESNIKYYEIQASVDFINFQTVKTIAATGSKNYQTEISLLAFAFLFPLLFVRKKKHFFIVLIATVTLYACKKENVVQSAPEYKAVKIVSVSVNGDTFSSNVVKL